MTVAETCVVETREVAVGGRTVVFKRYIDGPFSSAYDSSDGRSRYAHVTDQRPNFGFPEYISARVAELQRADQLREFFSGC